MDNVKVGIDAGQECPECGKPLLEKWGRFGKFLACSAYPDCKFTKDMSGGRERPADQPTDEICPTCSRPMVIKHGRFGKFIACSGYPECKTTKPVTLGHHVPAAGLRRPADREAHPQGQDLLRVHELPDLHVRGVDAAGGGAVPEVRGAVPDRADRQGGKVTRQCVREECGYRQEMAPTVA